MLSSVFHCFRAITRRVQCTFQYHKQFNKARPIFLLDSASKSDKLYEDRSCFVSPAKGCLRLLQSITFRRAGLAAFLSIMTAMFPDQSLQAQTRGDDPMSAGSATDSTALQPIGPDGSTSGSVIDSHALRRVTTLCQPELARFCPALEPSAIPRNQAICLKSYKTNLSLGCRHAVNAVTR